MILLVKEFAEKTRQEAQEIADDHPAHARLLLFRPYFLRKKMVLRSTKFLA